MNKALTHRQKEHSPEAEGTLTRDRRGTEAEGAQRQKGHWPRGRRGTEAEGAQRQKGHRDRRGPEAEGALTQRQKSYAGPDDDEGNLAASEEVEALVTRARRHAGHVQVFVRLTRVVWQGRKVII